jgi:hypothetical protein
LTIGHPLNAVTQGLGEDDESFRMSKHDLQALPVYHHLCDSIMEGRT